MIPSTRKLAFNRRTECQASGGIAIDIHIPILAGLVSGALVVLPVVLPLSAGLTPAYTLADDIAHSFLPRKLAPLQTWKIPKDMDTYLAVQGRLVAWDVHPACYAAAGRCPYTAGAGRAAVAAELSGALAVGSVGFGRATEAICCQANGRE